MSAVTTRALCLCCGTYYDVEGDCPRVETQPHSLELATDVSRSLLEQGIQQPDKHDVQETLREFGKR